MSVFLEGIRSSKKTKKISMFLQEKLEKDYLSCNPCLHLICQYLSFANVLRVMRLNSSSYRIINNHASVLLRRKGAVKITCTDNQKKSVSVCFWPPNNVNMEVTVTIEPSSLTVLGWRAESFANEIQRFKGIPPLGKISFSKYQADIDPSKSVRVLKNVMALILSRFEPNYFEMIEVNKQTVCLFSDDQLKCIRDCLRDSRKKIDKTKKRISMRWSGTRHTEIIDTLDWKFSELTVLSDKELRDIPTNFFETLIIVGSFGKLDEIEAFLLKLLTNGWTGAKLIIQNKKEERFPFSNDMVLEVLSVFGDVSEPFHVENIYGPDFPHYNIKLRTDLKYSKLEFKLGVSTYTFMGKTPVKPPHPSLTPLV